MAAVESATACAAEVEADHSASLSVQEATQEEAEEDDEEFKPFEVMKHEFFQKCMWRSKERRASMPTKGQKHGVQDCPTVGAAQSGGRSGWLTELAEAYEEKLHLLRLELRCKHRKARLTEKLHQLWVLIEELEQIYLEYQMELAAGLGEGPEPSSGCPVEELEQIPPDCRQDSAAGPGDAPDLSSGCPDEAKRRAEIRLQAALASEWCRMGGPWFQKEEVEYSEQVPEFGCQEELDRIYCQIDWAGGPGDMHELSSDCPHTVDAEYDAEELDCIYDQIDWAGGPGDMHEVSSDCPHTVDAEYDAEEFGQVRRDCQLDSPGPCEMAALIPSSPDEARERAERRLQAAVAREWCTTHNSLCQEWTAQRSGPRSDLGKQEDHPEHISVDRWCWTVDQELQSLLDVLHACDEAEKPKEEERDGAHGPPPARAERMSVEEWCGIAEDADQHSDVLDACAAEKAPRICCTVKLDNINYAELSADAAVLDAFKKRAKESFAAEAGNNILQEHVEVELSAGSVVVDATIIPPGSASLQGAQSKLSSPSSTLFGTLVENISGLPGIEAVVSGPITASFVHPPTLKVTAEERGDAEPLAEDTNPKSWEDKQPSLDEENGEAEELETEGVEQKAMEMQQANECVFRAIQKACFRQPCSHLLPTEAMQHAGNEDDDVQDSVQDELDEAQRISSASTSLPMGSQTSASPCIVASPAAARRHSQGKSAGNQVGTPPLGSRQLSIEASGDAVEDPLSFSVKSRRGGRARSDVEHGKDCRGGVGTMMQSLRRRVLPWFSRGAQTPWKDDSTEPMEDTEPVTAAEPAVALLAQRPNSAFAVDAPERDAYAEDFADEMAQDAAAAEVTPCEAPRQDGTLDEHGLVTSRHDGYDIAMACGAADGAGGAVDLVIGVPGSSDVVDATEQASLASDTHGGRHVTVEGRSAEAVDLATDSTCGCGVALQSEDVAAADAMEQANVAADLSCFGEIAPQREGAAAVDAMEQASVAASWSGFGVVAPQREGAAKGDAMEQANVKADLSCFGEIAPQRDGAAAVDAMEQASVAASWSGFPGVAVPTCSAEADEVVAQTKVATCLLDGEVAMQSRGSETHSAEQASLANYPPGDRDSVVQGFGATDAVGQAGRANYPPGDGEGAAADPCGCGEVPERLISSMRVTSPPGDHDVVVQSFGATDAVGQAGLATHPPSGRNMAVQMKEQDGLPTYPPGGHDLVVQAEDAGATVAVGLASLATFVDVGHGLTMQDKNTEVGDAMEKASLLSDVYGAVQSGSAESSKTLEQWVRLATDRRCGCGVALQSEDAAAVDAMEQASVAVDLSCFCEIASQRVGAAAVDAREQASVAAAPCGLGEGAAATDAMEQASVSASQSELSVIAVPTCNAEADEVAAQANVATCLRDDSEVAMQSIGCGTHSAEQASLATYPPCDHDVVVHDCGATDAAWQAGPATYPPSGHDVAVQIEDAGVTEAAGQACLAADASVELGSVVQRGDAAAEDALDRNGALDRDSFTTGTGGGHELVPEAEDAGADKDAEPPEPPTDSREGCKALRCIADEHADGGTAKQVRDMHALAAVRTNRASYDDPRLFGTAVMVQERRRFPTNFDVDNAILKAGTLVKDPSNNKWGFSRQRYVELDKRGISWRHSQHASEILGEFRVGVKTSAAVKPSAKGLVLRIKTDKGCLKLRSPKPFWMDAREDILAWQSVVHEVIAHARAEAVSAASSEAEAPLSRMLASLSDVTEEAELFASAPEDAEDSGGGRDHSCDGADLASPTEDPEILKIAEGTQDHSAWRGGEESELFASAPENTEASSKGSDHSCDGVDLASLTEEPEIRTAAEGTQDHSACRGGEDLAIDIGVSLSRRSALGLCAPAGLRRRATTGSCKAFRAADECEEEDVPDAEEASLEVRALPDQHEAAGGGGPSGGVRPSRNSKSLLRRSEPSNSRGVFAQGACVTCLCFPPILATSVSV